jgi:hypothetical protein
MSGTSKRPQVGPDPASRGIADARAVLALDDGASASASDPTTTGVSRGDDPLVVVGFTRGDWGVAAEHVGEEREVWLVDAAPSGGEREAPDRLTVEPVGSPADLTGVGIALEECCERLASADGSPVCWVPSLTALLQYVDAQRGYRFCNAVANRVAGVGGSTLFTLQPGAHDNQTVATFESLVDAVVDQSTDGANVRRRRRSGHS